LILTAWWIEYFIWNFPCETLANRLRFLSDDILE
jgi:hypothetical protein